MMQVCYGIATSTEVAYYSYIYAKVTKLFQFKLLEVIYVISSKTRSKGILDQSMHNIMMWISILLYGFAQIECSQKMAQLWDSFSQICNEILKCLNDNSYFLTLFVFQKCAGFIEIIKWHVVLPVQQWYRSIFEFFTNGWIMFLIWMFRWVDITISKLQVLQEQLYSLESKLIMICQMIMIL